MPLTATLSSPITSPCLARSRDQCLKQTKDVQTSFRVKPLCFQFHLPERKRIITHSSRVERASVICAAALNATCSAESQTQTVTRQSSTITVAPIQGSRE